MQDITGDWVNSSRIRLKDSVPGGGTVQIGPEGSIQFSGVEGCQPAEIYRQIWAVCGATRVLTTAFVGWH